MAVAWLFKRVWLKNRYQPLMLELPPYRWPDARTLALGLWERAQGFVRRVGTIIFALMVVLWFLASYPAAPAGASATMAVTTAELCGVSPRSRTKLRSILSSAIGKVVR